MSGIAQWESHKLRALAVCQDELVIRTLHPVLSGVFDVEFLVESRPLARRLGEDGIPAIVADPRRVDTYVRADVSPNTCIIVEDDGRRSSEAGGLGDPRRRRDAALRLAGWRTARRQEAHGRASRGRA